jgi:DME family drug/metabolite transporter
MRLSLFAYLALISAIFSAGATVLIRQGLRDASTHTGYWLNLVVGVIGLWAVTLIFTPADISAFRAVPFFVLSGLLGTIGGRFTRFVAIEKVGAAVAASINNLNPFISTGLAILLLGEHVTLPMLGGTCLIVMGTILLSLSGRHVGFRPWQLIYPFTAAACFGMVAIIRKLGLSQTGPLFGSAVNMTTAWVVFTAFLTVSGQARAMRCRGRSCWYFVAAGVAENAGVCLMIVALSLEEVSVVAPLAGTAPLFVLPMSYFFLRGVEALTWRIVAGALLIVGGVVMLTGFSS